MNPARQTRTPAAATPAARLSVLRLGTPRRLGWALGVAALVLAVLGLAAGSEGWSFAWGDDAGLITAIRAPRTLGALLAGALLGLSGALAQGLFRNPLADPGIVGVSAGAGLGAVLAIVLGGLLPLGLVGWAGPSLVAVAAGLGGWVTTLVLYRVATRGRRTDVALMLLAGIALAALAWVSSVEVRRGVITGSFGSLGLRGGA